MLEVGQLFFNLGVRLGIPSNRADGVQNRRMVAAAEVGADLLQRQPGELPGEVHPHLPGPEHAAAAALGAEVAQVHPEMAAHPRGDSIM